MRLTTASSERAPQHIVIINLSWAPLMPGVGHYGYVWVNSRKTPLDCASVGEGGNRMSIDNALASVAVKDLKAAVAWYEQLFERPADSTPMPEVAEWKF